MSGRKSRKQKTETKPTKSVSVVEEIKPAIDQEPKPEEKKTKIADRPHLISIVLSIVAVIISCFSWWESHNSRLISQSSNRAIVYARVLKGENTNPESGPNYRLIIKNFGKSNALHVNYKYNVVVSAIPNPNFYNLRQEGFFIGNTWTELPPGMEREDYIPVRWGDSNWKLHKPESNEDLFMFASFSYIDEVTGQEYKQDICFALGNRFSTYPDPNPEVPSFTIPEGK